MPALEHAHVHSPQFSRLTVRDSKSITFLTWENEALRVLPSPGTNSSAGYHQLERCFCLCSINPQEPSHAKGPSFVFEISDWRLQSQSTYSNWLSCSKPTTTVRQSIFTHEFLKSLTKGAAYLAFLTLCNHGRCLVHWSYDKQQLDEIYLGQHVPKNVSFMNYTVRSWGGKRIQCFSLCSSDRTLRPQIWPTASLQHTTFCIRLNGKVNNEE